MNQAMETTTNPTDGTTHRTLWWLPLVIPAIFIALIEASAVSKGSHMVHTRPGTAIEGVLLLIVAVVIPAFRAGVQHESRTR